MKHLLASVLIVVSLGVGVNSSASPLVNKPFLYKVTGGNIGQREVWILGLYHFLTLRDFPEYVTDRLINWNTIHMIEEKPFSMFLDFTHINKQTEEFAQAGRPSLQDLLTSTEFDYLKTTIGLAYAEKEDFQLRMAKVMNPLLAIMCVNSVRFEGNFIDHEIFRHMRSGVDSTFLDLRGEAYLQVAPFWQENVETLKELIASAHPPADLDIFLKGEESGMEEYLKAFERKSPKVFKAMISDRNVGWRPQLVPWIEREGIHRDRVKFISVGAAHLFGPTGMLTYLRSQGYQVERHPTRSEFWNLRPSEKILAAP